MKKRSEILGECFHRARRKLVSSIIRKAFEINGELFCIRCGEEIEGIKFHIDHVKAWLNSHDPINLFFDLNNIGLSHPECNSAARFQTNTQASIQNRVTKRLLTRRIKSRLRKRLAKKKESQL